MKRIIRCGPSDTDYDKYSISDTGSGYKVGKFGNRKSNVEYPTFEEAVESIRDNDGSEIKKSSNKHVNTEVDYLELFSKYAKNLPGRINPNKDGVYSRNRRALYSYFTSFKKKFPNADLTFINSYGYNEPEYYGVVKQM